MGRSVRDSPSVRVSTRGEGYPLPLTPPLRDHMMSVSTAQPTAFVKLGGVAIAITAASVEQTGFIVGEYYRMTAAEDACVCRWGTTDAAPADGSFDFAIGANESVTVIALETALNVEEASSVSAATAALFVAKIDRNAY